MTFTILRPNMRVGSKSQEMETCSKSHKGKSQSKNQQKKGVEKN